MHALAAIALALLPPQAEDRPDAELIALVRGADATTVDEVATRLGEATDGAPMELLRLLAATRFGGAEHYGIEPLGNDAGAAALRTAVSRLSGPELSSAALQFARLRTESPEILGEPHTGAAVEALVLQGSSIAAPVLLDVLEAAGIEGGCPAWNEATVHLTQRLATEPGLARSSARVIAGRPVASSRIWVTALGSSRCPDALDALLDCLAGSTECASDVLRAIAPLVVDAGAEQRRAVARVAVEWISSPDPMRAQVALRVVGACRAAPHAESLVEVLSSEHRGVREAARSALRDLTGMQFPAQAEPWRVWLAGERAWHRDALRDLCSRVDVHHSTTALRAVECLARHRLYAEELGPVVARALEHPAPEVACAACAALAELDSPVALERLAELVDDPSPGLSEAAERALMRLTGSGARAGSEDWLRVVQGRSKG